MMAMDGFLELALHSTFQLTSNFPDEKVFDLLMHVIYLRILYAFVLQFKIITS